MDEFRGFVGRSIAEYRTPTGRRAFRCQAPHNPLAYHDGARFHPIDITHVGEAGGIWLRGRNVVSVGVKLADDGYKFLGLRPDENQGGSEQLEWTLDRIETNGRSQSLNMSNKSVLSPVAQNLGPLVVHSNRQRTRLMLPMTGADEGFKVSLRLHLKGLTPFYKPDLDEYWIYNSLGQFRFRIGRPHLVIRDGAGFEPLDLTQFDHPPVFVTHSLTDNGDGTWSYVKEPGPDFGKLKLPGKFWVDADTVYSSTADGHIDALGADWATIHDATTGSANSTYTRDTLAIDASEFAGTYYISRAFFYFDVSSISGSLDSCSQFVYGYSNGGPTVVALQGTQGSSVDSSDYDNFGSTSFGTKASWSSSSYNEIVFNASGISYAEGVLGGAAQICNREYTHDFLDSVPSDEYSAGCYFSDYTGTDHDPYLYVVKASSTYSESVTDGIALGDSVSRVLSIPAGASDGLTLGDSVAGGMVFSKEASDGITLGDETSMLRELNLEATDGLVLSDTIGSVLAALGVCTDGLVLGDSIGSVLLATASATDSILLADQPTANLLMSVAVDDQVVLSDSVDKSLIISLSLSDSLILGDRVLIPATGLLRAVFVSASPRVVCAGAKPIAVIQASGPTVSFTIL